MQIIKGSTALRKIKLKNPVVTLGNFDGVHKGHQIILKKVVQIAADAGGASIVYTFDPHPLNILRPDKDPPKITTFEEKAALIEEMGIAYLVCEKFTTRFAEMTAEDFVAKIIHSHIEPVDVVIGHDYAFGKSREGNVELLEKLGAKYGFRVHITHDITIKNIPVRSTTIRNLIRQGKVSLAGKLLGRDYCISGTVVHGEKREIGFPTANLSHIRDLIPADGVYAVRIKTPGGMEKGVVNIGFNPTFGMKKRCVETHIFDFSSNIYGEEITICFVRKIRGEKKFSSVDSLVEQIKKDIAFAKKTVSKQ